MAPDSLAIPQIVIDGVQSLWPERADAWIAAAASELPELCDRFNATPRTVFQARYGYLVAADTARGSLVFRSTPDPAGPIQASVAAALADLGAAPVVHDITTTATGTWTVLDEVRPGTPLPHADRTALDFDRLAAPLRLIRDQPAPAQNMPTVVDWLHARLVDDDLADLPPNATVAPLDERRYALDVLDELAHGWMPALCHGDTSGWNFLADGDCGWLLIDPRGISGEAAYDVAVLSAKLAGNRNDPEVAKFAAELAGVDPERVTAWMTVANAARV
jgi:streptomycin 6-kinase